MSAPGTGGWTLAIDFGSSFTAAALWVEGERPEVIGLEEGRPIASTVVLAPDGEGLVVGEAASSQAILTPDRFVEAPKRALQRGDPVVELGGEMIQIEAVVGAILSLAWREGLRRRNGRPPARTVLTHPAAWSSPETEALVRCARRGGVAGEIDLISEPVAAALHFAASGATVAEGAHVAVYDLGGGTFDAAVLRRDRAGFAVVGRPLGLADVGGLDLDKKVADHIVALAAEGSPQATQLLLTSDDYRWRRARRALRVEARQAKERLSFAERVHVVLPDALDHGPLSLDRATVERLVRPAIDRSLDTLDQALRSAGVAAGDLAGLFLVGGSARIPLVARLVEERLGRRPDTRDDPKSVVALGAVRADDAVLAGAPAPAPAASAAALTPPPPPDPPRPAQPPPATGPPPAAAPVGAAAGGRPSLSQRAWIAIGAGGAAAIAVVVALVLLLSGGGSEQAYVPPPATTEEQVPEEPVPEEVSLPTAAYAESDDVYVTAVSATDDGSQIEVAIDYCDSTPGAVNDFTYTVAVTDLEGVREIGSADAAQTEVCPSTVYVYVGDFAFATGYDADVDVVIDNHTNFVSATGYTTVPIVN